MEPTIVPARAMATTSPTDFPLFAIFRRSLYFARFAPHQLLPPLMLLFGLDDTLPPSCDTGGRPRLIVGGVSLRDGVPTIKENDAMSAMRGDGGVSSLVSWRSESKSLSDLKWFKDIMVFRKVGGLMRLRVG